MVEAEGDDFENDVDEDFLPVGFSFFLFHNDTVLCQLVFWSTGCLLVFVDIIDAEEGTGESCGFAEGYQERGVDFSLRVNKDTAEEKD